MGMLEPNTIVGILNGKVGNLVLVRMPDGRVVVRRRPVREAGFTGPELVVQSRFKRAVAYVERIRRQPAEYGVYQAAAKLKGKRACDLSNADFRRPPQITDVDLSGCTGAPGELIRVQAIDDFEVSRVCVTIARLDGTMIEHGTAALNEGFVCWEYVTQSVLPAGQTVAGNVSAFDRPGNTAAKTLHLALVPLA